MTDRLDRQIAFLMEIDRLKHVYRQTYLLDRSRHDSDVEHSWHFAVMALVLSEYAKDTIDVFKVIRMALIHDIVEIDAGDLCVYDNKDPESRRAVERRAAERIFGILPADQAKELIGLWEEFERRETPEAKFAAAMDRVDPVLHNCYTEGMAWKDHDLSIGEVMEINSRIGAAAPELWDKVQALIRSCAENGHLKKDGHKKQ